MVSVMVSVMVGVMVACLVAPRCGASDDPHDQFDFWLGEWTVTNRHLRNGAWPESGTSTALILPVLDGRAVLEQWDGQPGGMSGVFGFSLRWYDEELERWVVLLNWPGGSPRNPTFGRMEGVFDESGVCALFPPNCFAGPGGRRVRDATRYMFSDATPESCRWTQANPGERGSFHDSWTMDFAREAPAVAQGTPPAISPAPESCACDAEEARALDPLIGVWAGVGERAGAPTAAAVRISSAIRGCMTLVSVRLGSGEDAEQSRFIALAYDRNASRWTARSLDRDLALGAWVGGRDEEGLTLRSTGQSDPDRRGETLRIEPEGERLRLVIERADDGAPILDLTLERG